MTDMEKGNIYDLGGFGLGEFEGIDTQGEEQTYKFATPTGPRYLKPEVFRELNRVQTRGVGPFHKMTTADTQRAEITRMMLNINGKARVRLTDQGRMILKTLLHREQPGEIDGWSEWVIWDLMNTFGPFLYNGCNPPFETTIEVIKLEL